MCEPISLTTGLLIAASAGTTATSAIVAHKSASKEADRVNAENEQYYEQNKADSIIAANLNQREISLRESEELLASAAAQNDITQEEQAALSTARLSAADAGVSGNSVDAVLNDLQRQASKQRLNVRSNTDRTIDQLQREKEGVLVDARSNINAVRKTEVRKPNILVPILQTAGAGLGALDYVNNRAARAKGEKI